MSKSISWQMLNNPPRARNSDHCIFFGGFFVVLTTFSYTFVLCELISFYVFVDFLFLCMFYLFQLNSCIRLFWIFYVLQFYLQSPVLIDVILPMCFMIEWKERISLPFLVSCSCLRSFFHFRVPICFFWFPLLVCSLGLLVWQRCLINLWHYS